MSFRFDEIGNRLKAYRLGSGLTGDEIAKRLGISRTALYRFEKGELAKIETLERLGELLGVSIPTLLGVGIEYIPSAVSYFERMRQIEESVERMVVFSGPMWFLLASDAFQHTLREVLTENITKNDVNRARALSDVSKIMDILGGRKQLYQRRRPVMINLMSALEIERFIRRGFIGRNGLAQEVLAKRKAMARAEVERFANIIEEQPMDLQIGIVTDTLPHSGFQLVRQPGRRYLVLCPFRLGGEPNVRAGVAMISSAPDAISLYESTMKEMWARALKGQAAADCLRRLLANQGNPLDADDLEDLHGRRTSSHERNNPTTPLM
jgi:transcriptional regulator with XRE-family HTH domain